MATQPTPRTRLAPSPTGALHLGNARTFLINWAMARRHDWDIVLRIDDLDGPRVKPKAAAQAIDTLAWLGLDWRGEPVFQSQHREHYESALQHLREHRYVYPCCCTRAQIQSLQSAPQEGDHELRYPGTCRTQDLPTSTESVCWRFRVDDASVEFHDEFCGPQSVDVMREVGDFVVSPKTGGASYQLAVVVDDTIQQVTHVVRGDDLLSSTARQLLTRNALQTGRTCDPPSTKYWHIPLIKGEDGRRLAKRHGDTRLQTYRDLGVTPYRIIGLLAEWSGLGPRCEMSAAEFASRFVLSNLSPDPVQFTSKDDRWLRARN